MKLVNPLFSPLARLTVFARRALPCGVGAAALLVGFTHVALTAQDQSPQPFTLPDTAPTPNPTQSSPTQTPAPTTAPSRAPQGPEDELSGVPIRPRIIPRNPQTGQTAPATTSPSPSSTPSPAPAQSPSPATRRAPLPSRETAPVRTPPAVRNADAPGAVIGGSSPSDETPSANTGTNPGTNTGITPGFDTLGEEEGNVPRSADGWYNVDEAGSSAQGSATSPAQTADNAVAAPQAVGTVWDRLGEQSGVLAAVLALLALLAGIGGIVFMRRKRAGDADLEAPAMALTAGVRASMGEEADPGTAAPKAAPDQTASVARPPAPSPAPAARSPVPPVSPVSPTPVTPVAAPQLDVALDIIGATRSLMRLSVEFSLEITNRAQSAVRDIDIAGELACAQEGSAGVSPVDKTQSLAAIDRLAPQQSRRVTGTLQLPVSEITAIKQNGKPVVIPLVHLRIGPSQVQAIKRTFVLGTPSSSSVTRVHPLLLDGPPGSLPPLRAQLIKTPA